MAIEGRVLEPNHPELREGEVYLGTFSEEGFSFITWKSKRRGITRGPYFPVFAERAELHLRTV